MGKLKVLELFGGIGACSKALERLGVYYEIADYVEIDKYAVKSFNAIHGTNFEPQDITKWDKGIDVDLIMHGSPCQDFSVAGRGAGGDEGSGTRSSLMYETIRIVEKLKPKYVIWENVKNLLSKKHRHNFDAYQETMKNLGYTNYYQVLNAKDYGIPQNRERVFTVSIRNDIHKEFVFPEPIPLEKKLKDVLEKEVDEKYYLSDAMMNCFMSDGTGNYPRKERFLANINRKNQDIGNSVTTNAGSRPTDNFVVDDMYKNREPRVYNETSPTLRSERAGLKVVEPFVVASRGRNPDNPSDRTPGIPTEQRLEPKFDGTTNTITTVQKDNYVALPGAYGRESGSKGKIQDIDKESATLQAAMGEGGGNVPLVAPTYRIRKLTPKECWRLMGFDGSDFEKAEKVNSNTQLYKQAGNSIVVNVLEAILKELING